MMYSFICSEEQTTLCTSDILPEKDTMLSGMISISLHPTMFITDNDSNNNSSINMHCKLHNSCLDMLMGNSNTCNGNSMNMVGIPARDLTGYLLISKNMINIDTCRVYCTSCGEYLGDGVFDSNSSTENESNTTPVFGGDSLCLNNRCNQRNQHENNIDSDHYTIKLTDLCDIRLLGNKINLHCNSDIDINNDTNNDTDNSTKDVSANRTNNNLLNTPVVRKL